jgi:hypothetical protein
MDAPLQPLRIPTGWTVVFNDGLYEIDPVPEAIPEDEHLCFFKEDMLLMLHADQKLHLDVGWFPSGDLVRGEYCLVLAESDSYDQPVREFRTRDRSTLIAEIERLLADVSTKIV